jgi:hypothetical protein
LSYNYGTCLEQDFSGIDFAAEKKVGCTVTAFAPIPRCYSLIPEDELMSVQFSLRFLGIILRVLRLEVSVWISETIWFSMGFLTFPFTVYGN